MDGSGDQMPWYARVGAAVFVLIAIAGIALILQRGEWGASALRKQDETLLTPEEQLEQMKQQQLESNEARNTELRQQCVARQSLLQQAEENTYSVYLQRPPMNCTTARTQNADRSLGAIHHEYHQLRASCAAITPLPDRLNGRTQEDAAHIDCYGRPRESAPALPDKPDDIIPAQPPPVAPSRPAPITVAFGDMIWRERPSARDFANATPNNVRDNDYPGRVRLRCTIDRDGELECSVMSEDPPRAGFGQAALRLSRNYRSAAYTSRGVATAGAVVEMPLRFDPPED